MSTSSSVPQTVWPLEVAVTLPSGWTLTSCIGHSGTCETFGSPTLSNKDEFAIQRLELWFLS